MEPQQPVVRTSAPRSPAPVIETRPVEKPIEKPVEKPVATSKPVSKPQPTVSKAEVERPSKKPAKGQIVLPSLPGPDITISEEKQQRLEELLRKYKADEISPEEYHQQRAKILSGQ